jgi:hypothetical protein
MRCWRSKDAASAFDVPSSSSRLLPHALWRRRKGRHVRRTPLTLSGHCKRLRLQNRPLLSNTSCSPLLAQGCSTSASHASPP